MIYVCYEMYPYEGCSEPMFAFDQIDKAVAWASVDPAYRNFIELEVE